MHVIKYVLTNDNFEFKQCEILVIGASKIAGLKCLIRVITTSM